MEQWKRDSTITNIENTLCDKCAGSTAKKRFWRVEQLIISLLPASILGILLILELAGSPWAFSTLKTGYRTQGTPFNEKLADNTSLCKFQIQDQIALV